MFLGAGVGSLLGAGAAASLSGMAGKLRLRILNMNHFKLITL